MKNDELNTNRNWETILSGRKLKHQPPVLRLTSAVLIRYARYATVNGEEQRTLYKAFGIRFDVMVFGQVGAFLFPCATDTRQQDDKNSHLYTICSAFVGFIDSETRIHGGGVTN